MVGANGYSIVIPLQVNRGEQRRVRDNHDEQARCQEREWGRKAPRNTWARTFKLKSCCFLRKKLNTQKNF